MEDSRMATWKEIKAKRQGQTPAASSTGSWQEIKRSRGYEDPVFKEADQRRADASGRAATIVENRNAPKPVVTEDTGLIPDVSQRAESARKMAVTAPKVEKPNNLAMLNQVKNVRTREQIAESLGVLDKYTNPDSRYTMNDDVRKYVDNLYKRTGGVDVENDRDYQWVKDSIAKGVPYNAARLGRLVGGGLKSWFNSTKGTAETLAGLGAEGLAAQYNDPGSAVLAGLGAGLANGDVRGSVDKSVGDALQRQRDVIAQKPQMLAEGSASFDMAAQNIEDVGGNDTLGSKIVTMAASNAPDMILSMGIAGLTRAGATGAAKVGAKQLVKDLAKKETRKAALITIGKQAARSAIPEISTLPMGIKSFAGTYQSAIGKGADDGEAVAAALASAWVEAAIEGGGAQDVIKNAERGFKAWAKSALGEGSEELWQDWLAPAAEKYIAGIKGIKTFSMDPNVDSIFNPVRAGTAALGGAVIGGVVGLPSMIPESSYRDPRAPEPLRAIAEQMANRIMPEAAEAERQVAQRQMEQEEESRQKAESAVEGKTTEPSQPVKTAAISFSKYPDRKFEVRIYQNGERAIFEGDREIGRGVTTEKARTSAGTMLARERATQNAKPIEARTEKDMADNSTQAYQKMFPELSEGIRGMASRALQDLSDGTKGEKIYITDGASADGLTETVTGTAAIRRSQSEMIDDLQGYEADGGKARMEIGRLREALRNIVAGNDLVNRKIEKEVEQKLDQYLTNGTKDFRTGNPVLPDKAYSDAKAFIYRARQMEGKRGYSYSETELADAEAALTKHADRMEKDFGVRPEMKIVEPKKAVQKNIVKMLETVGMRAYYIDAKDEGNLAEYYDPNMPDVVFIKSGSKRDMSWAAGHGFFHSLKVNHPSLFKSAMDTFEKGITSEQIEKYLETFSETPDYQERLSSDKELLMEEMLADEMGNTWLSKGFWQDLMELSQEVFDKIRALVEDFFDTILKGFDNYLGEKQVQEMYDKFVMITGEVQERVRVGQEEGKEASEYDSMREQPEVEDLPFSARKKTPIEGQITMGDEQMSLDSVELQGTLLNNHPIYNGNKEALDLATQAIIDLQKTETGTISSVRGKLGAGIRTVAKAFSEPLVQSGRLAFIGQEIKSARDLASIAQILRDPRFETLRIVYMKNSVAVGYDAFSARLAGSAYPYAFKGEEQIQSLARDKKTTENQIHGDLSTKAIMDLRKKLNRLGADGYYLIHNHPSGSMVPSSADVNMTGNYMTRAPGFKGHIIINHNKFVAMLSAADIQKEYAMSGVQKAGANLYYAVDILGPQGNDPLRDTPIPHPLLGNKVLSGSALAAVAKELETEEDSVSIVYTSGQGAIEGVEVVPAGFVKSAGFTGYLNNMRRANGAIRAFIVADDTVYPTVEKEIDALIITGHIMDATTYQSARTRAESGVSARFKPKGYERSYRVDETAAYSARSKDEKTLWFSPERINRLMREYAASNPDYSKAYATFISPSDFLSLTTTNEARIVSEATPLDLKSLRDETQEIFLRFDEETGEITGHEGRHRMVALRNAGIEQVAIALVPDTERNKYGRKPIPSLEVTGEEFRTGRAPGRVTLADIIPISSGTRGEIEMRFAWGGEGAAYSTRRKAEIEEAFKDSKVRGADGKLLEVHHGTTDNFFSFSLLDENGRIRKKNGHIAGPGFYFSDNPNTANTYGGKVVSAYLNIQNPIRSQKAIGSEGYDWIVEEMYKRHRVDIDIEGGVKKMLLSGQTVPPDDLLVTTMARNIEYEDAISELYMLINER